MKHLTTLLLGISVCTMFVVSCVADGKDNVASEDVLGKWTLKQAYRGGKETKTLESVYFIFDENGQGKTNFNIEGEEKPFTYSVSSGQITFKGVNNLNIQAKKDDKGLLTFNTKLMNFDFKLILQPEEKTKKNK